MEKKKQESNDSKSKWLVLAFCVVITAVLASAITYLVVEKKDNNEILNNEELIENTEEVIDNENNTEKTSSAKLDCTELIDKSCLSEDNTQVYKNERLGIEFNYPKDWEITEETPREVDLEGENITKEIYNGIFLKLKNKDGSEVEATLENPTYDTGYEGYNIIEKKEYKTDYYNINLTKFEEDKYFMDADGKEGPLSNTVIVDLSPDELSIKDSFRLTLRVPDSNEFNDYYDFILQSASTFKKK